MDTNTGIGIGIGIPFKNNALGGDRPYLPPELKAKLIGVWDNYGKKNTDADRNIIKNKIPDRGGDFELLNFAYKLNSGYGKYEEDFTAWGRDASELLDVRPDKVIISDVGGINSYRMIIWKGNTHTKAFKAKVTGIPRNGRLIYSYAQNEGDALTNISIDNDGVYEFPYSYGFTKGHGFLIDSGTELEDWIGCTIEFIPSLQGSLCTDGVNDMIVSQNTVEEMGITDEVTVVSMIHQIDLNSTYTIATTNYIENSNSREHVRSDVYNYGKTGIYGYSASLINNTKSDIKNILGDKADYYVKSTNSLQTIFDAKFSVVGRISKLTEASQVAWYWTFIAKRVLTTDEINQVIAYYNLDKYVKPDIYYNVKKQGLTNDNHAQFGDKLIDYSGNSRDLQLFNIDWNPGSGIGKYVTNFGIWSKDAESKISYNSYSFTVNGSLKRTWLMWYVTKLPSFKIKVSGINSNGYVDYGYYDNGSLKNFRLDKDGIHTLPPSGASSNGHGFKVNDTSLDWTGLVIEQIPDFAGALCFDGVDDFGINKDVPTFTDFTVISKRTWLEENTSDKPFIIKGDTLYPDGNQNAFLFEYGKLSTYSFGQNNKYDESVVPSLISYATKYSYNGVIPLVSGSATDTIGIDVAHSTKIALYFLMLFPYSMSEFLIERQLKKRKLGTLYPGMVEFRPIISGRTDLIKKIKWYSDSWSKRIYVGDYIPRGVDVTANILLNDNTSELVKATYGNNYTEVRKQANWSETNNEWDLIIHNIGKSPQKIGITIDKYIRFEDIVQPYPAKFRFTDVDSGQVYDWGSKIKVGSTIKILSNVDIGNYLSDIYTITGYKYNGNIYSYNELKELTFLITNQPLEFASRKTYKLGGSEPKVILYPERLKLSNDTYKRLGYIPDLTGNGNHGVFNNLAFTEESGVNEDGSVHLDGVDDYISIPTLSKGGKQVLMKVNWSTLNGFIYDQRPASGDKTFGIYAQGDVIAYSQNNNGNTYIDGIINNNIIGSNLSKITHNIVATCDVDNSITPSIGKRSYSNSYFAQMALYVFMLFDEISTDDKIKELNTYIGITPKVTLPNYYWDNYGKKNTDAKRGYIDEQVSLQNTGTSVNPLENFNIGYEGMSGYNGYPVVFGANKTWETSNAIDYIYDINSTIVHITNVKHAANGLLYSYVKKDGALANIKEILAFRVTVKGLEGNSKLVYKYLATENATKESIVYLGNGTHKLPKSFVPTDALLDLTTNSWIGFAITPMIEGELVFDCDITIEILPEYENGLVYDGVSDFTDNKNIPIFTDFTAIIKRVDLDAKNDNSTVMFKGNKIYESSIGNGFILDYCYNSKNYVYSCGKLNQIERDDSKIIYLTPESYNGSPIIKGENRDNLGLVLGKYWKGIIYKIILYSKTISLLEINFLKNLMEKDEIIDINHPIFISNTEDESNASQDT